MSDQLYDAWSDACDRVRELEQQLDAAKAEVAHVKEVEFPRRVAKVVKIWRKKLAAVQAELEAERNRRFEGNRISSQEYNYSQKQVTLLRDALACAITIIGHPDDEGIKYLQKLLAATETKEQEK